MMMMMMSVCMDDDDMCIMCVYMCSHFGACLKVRTFSPFMWVLGVKLRPLAWWQVCLPINHLNAPVFTMSVCPSVCLVCVHAHKGACVEVRGQFWESALSLTIRSLWRSNSRCQA